MLSHYLKICARPGLAAAAVALMLTLLPADGTAQQTRRVILTDLPIAEQAEIATLAEASSEEADELLSRARTAQQSTDFRKAGELFERSGQLRTPGDRRGMEGFAAAGTAYFNADRPKQASRAWEEAGHRALILGNVYAASENYMQAAVAAHEGGSQIRASDMGWKAYHLTESPQLTRSQRTMLRRHVAVSPVSVEEARAEWRTVLPHMRLVTMDLIRSTEVERLRTVETHYRALRDSLARSTSRTPSSSERNTMSEMIHFEHDRSELSGEARAILRSKVPVFHAHPSMRITVTGYASQRGERAYNRALGLRRAETARAYLVSHGVAESRIDITTRGEDNLAVAGPSEAADAANRRGVFTILMAQRTVSQN